MVAGFGFSWSTWRRWTTATFRLWVGGDYSQAWCVEVRREMCRLVMFTVGIGDTMVARECRVWTFFHAFAPWFASKVWGFRFSTSRESTWRRCRLFHGPIEIHTNSITRFTRIFISQSKHKWGRITDSCRCSSSSWSAYTSLWLTKINHIDRKGKIRVIRRRIATKKFGYLRKKSLIKFREWILW